MKKCYTILLMLLTAGISMSAATQGALNGKFTVNAEGKQVQFAKGNLQYNPNEVYWIFAEHQYDYIGTNNQNISQGTSYEGMIDLFGWGTSGYNGKYPYMNSTTTSDYGNPDNDRKSDIAGTKYDWGAMLGDDIPGKWRTLTYGEWDYLFNTRANAAQLRGQATVNGKHGYILLPDNWTTPDTQSFTATPNNWTSNVYSTIGWAMMEAAGAVFLPCAGIRINGNTISLLDSEGYYWSSTADGKNNAYKVEFTETNAVVSPTLRQHGFAVRLVRDVPKYKVTLNVKQWNPSFEQGGTVAVQETDIDLTAVEEGTTIHLTATPDEGYIFDSWIGYDPETGLTVNSDTTVTAVFRKTWKVTIAENEYITVTGCKDNNGNVVDLNAVPDGLEYIDIFFTCAEGTNVEFIDGVDDEEWLEVDNSHVRLKVSREIELEITTFPIFYSVNLRAEDYSIFLPAPRREGERKAPMRFRGGRVVAYLAGTTTKPDGLDLIPYGTKLDIIAQAELGWTFVQWSNTSSTSNRQEVTITSDSTITAYFKEAATYTLTLQDDGNGVVTILNGDPGEEVYTTDEIPVYEGTPVILTAHPNLGYEFDHWDNYTAPVFDREMEDWIIPTITSDLTVKAHFRKKGAQPELAEGALPGLFTVGYDDDDKPIRIQFSKGNLQYIAGDGKTHATAKGTAQGTWQFAESQEEYIGSKNLNAAEDYEKPIDMFNYGTSGYNGRQPWLIQTDSLKEDIAGTNYDWGVYNAISNGGNKPGLWRTLTYDEWFTLLYNRNFYVGNPQYNCYGEYLHGLGKMFGENGLLLMPDGWVMPGELAKENITFLPNEVESYDVNKYNDERSAILEQSGVVFLPAAGARAIIEGIQEIMMVGMIGFTSSSSYFEAGDASGVGFTTPMGGMEGGAIMTTMPTGGKYGGGLSVRLVRDVPESEIPTQIENANTQNNTLYQVRKVLLTNGEIRIVLPDGTQYNLQGQKVK